MYCEMWIINALLRLGLLFMLTIKGLSTKCIYEIPQIRISSNITERYSNETVHSRDACVLYLTTNTNDNILAIFRFNDTKVLHGNIMVYDGVIISSNLVTLDPDVLDAKDTAISSRGSSLTIVFLQSLNQMLDVIIMTIETKRSYTNNAGVISIPQYRINEHLQYPKNIRCEYYIYPEMGSTTLLTLKDVEIDKNRGNPELVLIKSNNDLIYNVSCYPCTSTELKSMTIPFNAENVSIILDSNKRGTHRGKGFSAEYEVCSRKVHSRKKNLELPFESFHDTVGRIRCAYQLHVKDKDYLPIVSMQFTGEQQIDQQFIEIYDGSTNPSLLVNWTHFDGIESFAGNAESIIIVLNYNATHEIRSPVLTGNFTSTNKSCNTQKHVSTGIITSTTFYGKYSNNFRCNSTITTEENAIILLYFQTISIAWEVDPCGDYIELYESGRPMSSRVCNSSDQFFVSTSNEISIAFVTNDHTTDEGFTAVWTSCGGQSMSSTGLHMEGTYPEYVFSSNDTINCNFRIIPEYAEYIYIEEIHESTNTTCLNDTSFSNNKCKVSKMRSVMKNTTEVEYNPMKDNNYTIKWTACPQIFYESEGEIMSHGYPLNVNREMNCTYEIKNQRKDHAVSLYIDYDIGNTQTNCRNSSLRIEVTPQSSDVNVTTESIRLCGSQYNQFLKRDSVTVIALRLYVAEGESGRFKARYKITKAGTSVHKSSLIASFPWKEVGIAIGAAIVILVIICAISFCVKRNKKRKSSDVNENTNKIGRPNTDQNVNSNYAMITSQSDEKKEKTETNISLGDRKSQNINTEESPYEENPTYDKSRSYRPHKTEEKPQSVYDSSNSYAYSQVNRDYTKKNNNSDLEKPEISNSETDANKTDRMEKNEGDNGYATTQDLIDTKQGVSRTLDIEED